MRNTVFFRPVSEHRTIVANLKARFAPADVAYKDITLELTADNVTNIRLYRPPLKAPYPTLFFIPGTAFVAREHDITHMICSHLARISGCQVIVLNHRLAPEVKLPQQFFDILNLYAVITRDKDTLFNIDSQNISISGYSSGANLAALLGIFTTKRGDSIKSLILLSPIVDLSRSLKKYRAAENKDTAITESFVQWFLNLAIPTGLDPKYPLISPFWLKKQFFSNLPKTTLITGEIDRFRGDAEALFGKLRKSQVKTEKIVLKDMNHGFLWHVFDAVKMFGTIARNDLSTPSIPRLFPCYRFLKSPTLRKKPDDESSFVVRRIRQRPQLCP